MPPLPVAECWYDAEALDDGIIWIDEPHIGPVEAGNIWLVRGGERDLLVDTGTGLGDLRGTVARLTTHPVTAIATNGYYDHAGGLNQFEDRAIHRLDAERIERPTGRNTVADKYMTDAMFRALPREGFSAADYAVAPCAPTRLVGEGDLLDLGGRRLAVLHLPGITAGSIGLYEAETGALFTGDTLSDDDPLYDGEPADYTGDADREAFRRSLERLAALDVATVYPGHHAPFTGARMRMIIGQYLRAAGSYP